MMQSTIEAVPLNRYQRLQLAVAALVDERSIIRAYSGKGSQSLTWTRIDRAARELGFPPPPAAPPVPRRRARASI